MKKKHEKMEENKNISINESGKTEKTSDETDDFLRFLDSASPSSHSNIKIEEGGQNQKVPTPGRGNKMISEGIVSNDSTGLNIDSRTLSPPDQIRTSGGDKNANVTNKPLSKSGSDSDELDELERYLLNLNG